MVEGVVVGWAGVLVAAGGRVVEAVGATAVAVGRGFVGKGGTVGETAGVGVAGITTGVIVGSVVELGFT
jgi:hypothetical protein